uniref:BHLH domain-containing protein n=1 Tax=Plectus sambesii TaxID=2011161 RepID=A0A914WF68_9BILA
MSLMDGMGINDLLTAAQLIEENGSVVSPTRLKMTKDADSETKEKRPLKRGAYIDAASSKRCSNKQSRAAHNELEKTRRANLRGCLEYLKEIVPAGSDSPRNTTLSLLTRARHYIQTLEQRDRALVAEKQRLQDQQRLMRRHLELLTTRAQPEPPRKRSCSESSASTISVAADEANERQRVLEEDAQGEDAQGEVTPHSLLGEESATSSVAGDRSPVWLEYSPSAKPSITACTPPLLVDLYADGLLPALPLFHPRLSVYPYLGVDFGVKYATATMDMEMLQRQLLPQIPIVTASPMPLVMTSSGSSLLSPI